MMIESKKTKTIDIMIFVLIAVFTAVIILPVIWLVSASFQGPGEIYQIPFNWIPKEFKVENYVNAWQIGHLNTAFYSSMCISLIYITLHLICCTTLGYVFAKYEFKGKNIIFTGVLITMMIPQEITFFPVYAITKELNLINTYFGVVLPYIISGFGIFFMRQFATYIPTSIIEAAKIDGCSDFKTYILIGVPQMKSAIAALAILAFSFIWDEFAWSKLVLNSPEKLSLPIMLTTLSLSPTNDVKISELLAAAVIAMIPVVMLFLIFQKQFMESITNSGVKG